VPGCRAPGFDASEGPVLQVRAGGDIVQVGLSRDNIASPSGSSELAAELLEARIRQELRSATMRKTSHSDVEKDLALLRQMRAPKRGEVAAVPNLSTR